MTLKLNAEFPGWRSNRYMTKNVPIHLHDGGRLFNSKATPGMTCNKCNRQWNDKQLEKAIENREVFA